MSKPVHPWLFAAFPILFLVAHNRNVSTLRDAAPFLLIAFAVVALAMGAGALLFRGRVRKVAVIVSAAAVLFFSYGHVWTVAVVHHVAGVPIGDRFLIPVWAAAFAGVGVAVWRTKRPLPDLTRVLNIVSAVLVVTMLVSISGGGGVVKIAQAKSITALGGRTPAHPRDIYYFIFDRYADAETMKTHFKFDDSPTMDFLQKEGFVVEPGSRANYQNTHMSLASSLNMQHFDTLAKDIKKPSGNLEPIFDWIKRSAVARFVKAHGYRYVHVGSWARFTADSPIADVNLKPVQDSEFTRALYASTALSPLLRPGNATGSDSETERDATRGAFVQLDRAISMKGPKYVFTHFILPHPPYVFDRNGRYSPETTRDGNVHGYLEAVRWANTNIVRIVHELLDRPADEQPIVIIQADEGPYPRLTTKFPATWTNQPPGDLRVKYGILNAYFLPGIDARQAVYPTISPVNTFRVLFNSYFGTHLPLLPDTSYATVNHDDAYTLAPLPNLAGVTPAPFVH